jgi:hypothetical protein
MRRVLICTGILGGGTALTFAAAALAATLLPGGTVVPAANMIEGKWVNGGVAVPMPAPVPPVVVDDGTSSGTLEVPSDPLPSD